MNTLCSHHEIAVQPTAHENEMLKFSRSCQGAELILEVCPWKLSLSTTIVYTRKMNPEKTALREPESTDAR